MLWSWMVLNLGAGSATYTLGQVSQPLCTSTSSFSNGDHSPWPAGILVHSKLMHELMV